MANERSRTQVGFAYVERPIDFASTLTLAQSATVAVVLPRNFRPGRPCQIALKEGQTALEAGLVLKIVSQTAALGVVTLNVAIVNSTAGTIDAASKIYCIWQI